ncbi:MAG: hypothetical protein IH940_08205, partial [Acidobacteria bacterium]|nr:hypothetical protein [Acidobacteriota bacterium]
MDSSDSDSDTESEMVLEYARWWAQHDPDDEFAREISGLATAADHEGIAALFSSP